MTDTALTLLAAELGVYYGMTSDEIDIAEALDLSPGELDCILRAISQAIQQTREECANWLRHIASRRVEDAREYIGVDAKTALHDEALKLRQYADAISRGDHLGIDGGG